MRVQLDIDFAEVFAPHNFRFGVCNAPYLCEGGYNGPGQPQNNYAPLEHAGTIERSGESTRFWTDYRRQIELGASVGSNAFRTGIDWTRVQPTTSPEPGPEPAWDDDAVARYANIMATIQQNDMEPIVTLHHFTHPAWLGPNFWLSDDAPGRITAYARRVVEEVNDRLVAMGAQPMAHFVVFNELNLVPFGNHLDATFPRAETGGRAVGRAFDHLLTAYVLIYDALVELFEAKQWPRPHLGFGVAALCGYEGDKMAYDLVRLRSDGVARADVAGAIAERRRQWMDRIDPMAKAKLVPSEYDVFSAMVDGMAKSTPEKFPRFLDALYASPRPEKLDYLSTNVYEPFAIPLGSSRGDGAALRWWEYSTDVEVYATWVRAHADGIGELPLYLGENGMMYRREIGAAAGEPRPDGWDRERYLKTYLNEMVRLIHEGIPIKAYLFWSIVDDFEWADGYPPRCGLYAYDYDTHEIWPTDALGTPAGAIFSHLVTALRSGDKAQIRDAFVKRFVA